jgi:hypothetical protein
MTQADPHTPSAGQQQEYREEFHVMGEQLVTTVEQLLHEGNVHEGPGVWETMKQKLRYIVTLPDQTPDFAFAPSNPERPVRIHFVTHITMGGVDIYRL